jgi:hypothetical protein
VQCPPPSIEIENHEEYEVEKVLDSRQRWGKLEYLVHWCGYDINERTWEPAENLFKRHKSFIDDILINPNQFDDNFFLKLAHLRNIKEERTPLKFIVDEVVFFKI